MNQAITLNIRRISTFFFLLIQSYGGVIIAQEELQIKDKLGIDNVIPSSPSNASFERYGNIPVNLAFGVPNIQIPLYTIVSGDLTLPISISYHAGGNKVTDPGGICGLGWSLNAGGAITRTVLGQPDDKTTGYLSAQKDWYLDGINIDDYYRLQAIAEADGWDTKPDIFSYNFSGYSGKFIFDHNGDIKLIPYQPINVVESIEGGQLIGFTISLPDGTKYFFNDPEFTTTNSGMFSSEEYYSAWYLSKISTPTGDHIDFDYLPECTGPSYYYMPMLHTMTYQKYGNNSSYTLLHDYSDGQLMFDHLEIIEKKLEKISFANGYIKLNGTCNTLESIELRDLNNELKRLISFTLAPFDNHSDCYSNPDKCNRKKLTRLQIGDLVWEFSYEEILEPPIDTYNKDHWGYYNGRDNSTPIPDVIPFGGTTMYGKGADRNTNPDFIKFGLLKRIKYPSGGYTNFTFGANMITYCNQNGEIETVVKDSYTETIYHNSGQTTTSNTFPWPSFYAPKSNVVSWDPALKITLEVGTVKKPNLNAPQEYTHNPYFSMTHPKLNSTLLYTITGDQIASGSVYDLYQNLFILRQVHNVSLGAYSYEDDTQNAGTVTLLTSTNPSNFIKVTIERNGILKELANQYNANKYVGGVRIEAIENYDINGSLISKTVYNYNKPDFSIQSSGKLTQGTIEDLQSNSMYYEVYGPESYETCACSDIPHSPQQLVVYDNPLSGFGSAGSVVTYDHVTETILDKSSNSLGRTESDFINTYSSSGYAINSYPKIPFFDKSSDLGRIKEQRVYSNANTLVSKTSYQYAFKGFGNEMALSVSKSRNYDWAGYNYCLTCIGGQQQPDLQRYAFSTYTIDSYWNNQLKSKETTTFGTDGSELVVKNNYTYTTSLPIILPKKQQIIALDGTKSTTEYLYQQELYSSTEYPGIIREQKEMVSGTDNIDKVSNASIINYNLNKPISFYEWNSNEPDSQFSDLNLQNNAEIYDDGYDNSPAVTIEYNNGRVRKVIKKDGIVVMYYWGFNNTYPLAKLDISDPSILTDDSFALFAHLSELESYTEMSDQTVRNALKALNELIRQGKPTSVLITTYTYDPLVGMTSQTDANGETTYYEYDELGKLQTVKDDDGNILQHYEYHYQTQ